MLLSQKRFASFKEFCTLWARFEHALGIRVSSFVDLEACGIFSHNPHNRRNKLAKLMERFWWKAADGHTKAALKPCLPLYEIFIIRTKGKSKGKNKGNQRKMTKQLNNWFGFSNRSIWRKKLLGGKITWFSGERRGRSEKLTARQLSRGKFYRVTKQNSLPLSPPSLQ